MTKKEHKKYIKDHGDYSVDCNRNIFENTELDILEKYGHWFKALQDGDLLPINHKQKQFIKVANFAEEPNTEYERAWWKYLKRKEIEVNYKDSLYTEHRLNQDLFYNRDMYKQVRSRMYGVMKENHRM